MLVRSLSPTGLLEDTIQRSWRQVIAQFAGNGHTARFGNMLELPVAAFRGDEKPAIFSQFVQYLANLHAGSIA